METPKCFRVYLQFPFGGWRITLYLRCKPVFALPIAYPDLAEEYLLADKAHKLLMLKHTESGPDLSLSPTVLDPIARLWSSIPKSGLADTAFGANKA